MEIYECIACPRCGAAIGDECVQVESDGASGDGQHSDRIHAFIEHGSLQDRIEVHRSTLVAMKEVWPEAPEDKSLFLTDDELLDFLIAGEP